MPIFIAAGLLSSQLIVVADRVSNLDQALPEQATREMLIEAWPQFAKVGSEAHGEKSTAAHRSRPASGTSFPILKFGPTCRDATVRNCGDLQTETCKFMLDTCNQNEEAACKVLFKCWSSLTSQEKARCAVEATYAGIPKQIASYTVWLSCVQINYNVTNFSPSKTFVPKCSTQFDALQGVSCPAGDITPSATNPSRGSKRRH